MCQISDRLFSAARTLIGDGPIKQRLVAAWLEHLEALREDEIPEPIRQKFLSLRQALTAVAPTNGESAVQASVRKMSPLDAQRYATSILLMIAEMVRIRGSGERIAFVRTEQPALESVAPIPDILQSGAGSKVSKFLP